MLPASAPLSTPSPRSRSCGTRGETSCVMRFVLHRLKLLYRYTPLFGIAFAIGSVLWANLVYFRSVGVHGDAAGAGMAQGLAFIAFYALFAVYLMVLLPALVLFRNGTGSPRLVATMNALLLAPAVVGLGALAFDLLEELDRKRAARASYERFASRATTTEYRAPSGTFSFRYASSPDGLQLVEEGDGVLLFVPTSIQEDHRELVGGARIRRLSDSSGDIAERLSAEYSALTSKRCTVTPAREHPLEQFPPSRYQVFTLANDETNDECLYAYATLLGGDSQGFKSFYVIVPENAPGIALEVILDLGMRAITGPVEDNAPGGERVAWYDTLRLGP